MPATIEDLGKRVKSKYPGTYDDLPDGEVGRKVKAKFPGDYDDFVDIAPQSPMSGVEHVGKYMQDTVRNIPKSAGKVAEGITQAGPAMLDLAANPRKLPGAASGVVDYYKQRYGGLDAARNTFKEDPIGAVADILPARAILSGLRRASSLAVPSRALQSGGRSLYESALKPSTVATDTTVQRMVDMGLTPGKEIPISKGGMGRLRTDLSTSRAQRANQIAQATTGGGVGDPVRVASGVQSLAGEMGRSPTGASGAARASGLATDYLEKSGAKPPVPPMPTGLFGPNGQPLMNAGVPAIPPQPVPLGTMEGSLKELNAGLKGKFGKMREAADPVGTRVEKQFAEGIADQIYDALPELRQQGIDQSSRIELSKAIARSIRRDANKNPIGLIGAIVGGSVGAGTGNIPAAVMAAATARVIEMPQVKSQIAIMMNRAGRSTANAAGKDLLPGRRAVLAAPVIASQVPPLPDEEPIPSTEGLSLVRRR